MLIYKLNKKMSRKNLYEFIQKSFDEILKVKTKYKVLNIGSGGEIQKIIKKNFLSRIFGNILTLISYILIPFFLLLQKIFPSNRVTTGYFLKAKK